MQDKKPLSEGPLKDGQKGMVSGEEEEEMANVLNDYFVNVSMEKGDGLVPKSKIKKLCPGPALGPNKIGPELLQQLLAGVAPILEIIY